VLSLIAVVISIRGFERGALLVLAVAVIMLLGMTARKKRAMPRLERRKTREQESERENNEN